MYDCTYLVYVSRHQYVLSQCTNHIDYVVKAIFVQSKIIFVFELPILQKRTNKKTYTVFHGWL